MQVNTNQNHSGIGDNIVNVGNPQRSFSNVDPKLKQVLDNLSSGTLFEITVVANDLEASNFASEIMKYLESKGHSTGPLNKIISADTLVGVYAGSENNIYKITIGHNMEN